MKEHNNKGGLSVYIIAFMQTWGIMLVSDIAIRNPLSLLIFVAAIFTGHKIIELDTEGYYRQKSVIITAIFFAAATLIAGNRDYTASYDSALFKALVLICVAVSMFMVYRSAMTGLLIVLNKIKKADKTEPAWLNKLYASLDKVSLFKHPLITTMIVCLVCWLPYFLYEFPGIMSADSLNQFEQALFIKPWSNHHPVVHTLFIYLFYHIGLIITGNRITAISFYTVAQMIFMSYCAGRVVRTMHKYDVARWFRIVTIIFYALVPFNAVMSVIMWKDVPFAGITSLFICCIVDILHELQKPDGGTWSLMLQLRFYIVGIMFCLFRTNAWYAFIIFAICMLYVFRRQLKKVSLPIILVVISVIMIKGPVMNIAGIEQPDFVESLSVPLQQVARVLVDDKDLTDSELELIDKVIDRTYIKQLYAADFADNIKELVRAGQPEYLEAHKFEYFKLWLSLGIRYPGAYLNAWSELTRGFWYPNISYEVATIDGIMNNDLGIYSIPIIGGKFVKVKEVLIKLGSFLPIYGLIWSAGTYCWLLVIELGIIFSSLYRNDKWKAILIIMPCIALELTLFIATPVVDFRYIYGIVLSAPLWLSIIYKYMME